MNQSFARTDTSSTVPLGIVYSPTVTGGTYHKGIQVVDIPNAPAGYYEPSPPVVCEHCWHYLDDKYDICCWCGEKRKPHGPYKPSPTSFAQLKPHDRL